MSRRGNRHFKKQLNNQGFSLLELLVVIAIIAVVSLLVTVGLTVLNKGNAKKANKNLYSSLSELKTSTMAKNGNWYMEIGKDGDSYVFTTYNYYTALKIKKNNKSNLIPQHQTIQRLLQDPL